MALSVRWSLMVIAVPEFEVLFPDLYDAKPKWFRTSEEHGMVRQLSLSVIT